MIKYLYKIYYTYDITLLELKLSWEEADMDRLCAFERPDGIKFLYLISYKGNK